METPSESNCDEIKSRVIDLTIDLEKEIQESEQMAETNVVKNVVFTQDFQQRTNVTITVLLELYRVLISSFLILFVPQKCYSIVDGESVSHVCTITENAQTGTDPLYNAGFAFNCFTMAVFIVMYYAEIRRENKLIAYLDVNPKCSSDNDSVGLVLSILPEKNRNSIRNFDKMYTISAYIALATFIVNTVLSGLVVSKYYLDDKTASTFVTSVLFMVTKMGDVYTTVQTEPNVYYSAYMKGKVQYNDIDEDKKLRYLQVAAANALKP